MRKIPVIRILFLVAIIEIYLLFKNRIFKSMKEVICLNHGCSRNELVLISGSQYFFLGQNNLFVEQLNS